MSAPTRRDPAPEPPNRDSGGSAMLWLGGGAGLIVAAVLVTLAARFMLGDDADDAAEPILPAATTIYETPDADAAVVGRFPAGTAVRVVGRSPDATWLVVQALPPETLVGWVRRADVADPGDIEALTLIDDGSAAEQDAATDEAPPPTPDHPDLVIVSAASGGNVLTVTVANHGDADIGGPITVAVGDGEPHRIDVGKPLRPGDELPVTLDGEYVQLRAFVTITVQGPDGSGEPTDNNTHSTIVEPDQPNDIEILEVDGGDGTPLRVGVRNNSPIPLVGDVTIVVRDDRGSGPRLGRLEGSLNLAPQAVRHYTFSDLTEVDLTRVLVLLSTGAISDASALNDAFPR